MILYNTSFHVDESIENDFLVWLKTEAIESHRTFGMTDPMLAKLLTSVGEGCSSFALHFHACDHSVVNRWERDGQPGLFAAMNKRWGQRALAVSTTMEVVDL